MSWALRATGVTPILGRFKQTSAYCRACKQAIPRWEEKESDVALSLKLIEVLHREEAEATVIVSGDTDLIPTIRTAKELFPDNEVVCLFPYRRQNNDLAGHADRCFRIRAERYAQHQLPDPVTSKRGPIQKPPTW